MDKPRLHIIKIGGNVIDDGHALRSFITHLCALPEPFILVHGGGKLATALSGRLGIPVQMIEGRRVTDEPSLEVAVMVYAGLVNKQIVAALQAGGKDAIGLCGADAGIIPAQKRASFPVDYGLVGDISPDALPTGKLRLFIDNNLCPVIAPITCSGNGQLLNTNADTIASSLAVALSGAYHVSLAYCFEKNGVLGDAADEQSVIAQLDAAKYRQLKETGAIHSGMIPKLDNAFGALQHGVRVTILHAAHINQYITHHATGTTLVN